MTPIDSGYMVMFLRTFALSLIIYMLYLLFTNWEENKTLLAVLGILVSALLASYSVILNIDTNIKLKKKEFSDEIRHTFFKLCLIKMRLITLINEKPKEKISFLDVTRIFDTLVEINELLQQINSINTVSIVHNSILTELHFLILEMSSKNTALKQIRENINKPEQNINSNLFPNPLKMVNFELEKSLKKLTKILTYLKDGYKDYFPDTGGIENCAKYSFDLNKLSNQTE